MDSMEDSGFDSDPKPSQNGDIGRVAEVETKTSNVSIKAVHRPSDLQKKLERQRDVARKAQTSGPVDQQPKKQGLLNRSRLIVPTKYRSTGDAEHKKGLPDESLEPLVALESDDSDDDFGLPTKATNKEITEQLIKDGYNLDLLPDDEDLDLIPPRPMVDRCVCCQVQSQGCSIQ